MNCSGQSMNEKYGILFQFPVEFIPMTNRVIAYLDCSERFFKTNFLRVEQLCLNKYENLQKRFVETHLNRAFESRTEKM